MTSGSPARDEGAGVSARACGVAQLGDRCPCCGYDLQAHAATEGPCPECGASAQRRREAADPRALLALAGAPLVALVCMWALALGWFEVAHALNPGDPKRGISPMGPETTERYAARAALAWSFAWPAILSLVTVAMILRQRPWMPDRVVWLLRGAYALTLVTVLSLLVADGTTSSSATLIGRIGNVFVSCQPSWMTLALAAAVALLAPSKGLRTLGWVCAAVAGMAVLMEARYEIPLLGLALDGLSHDAQMAVKSYLSWATLALASWLAAMVLWGAWLARGQRREPTPRAAAGWMRVMTTAGWILAALLPAWWWAIRAPLAGLGYPEATWFALLARWIVTFVAASAWVVPVLLVANRSAARAWVAAACAAVLSVLLLAGRSAPEGHTPPWTLPEVEFEDDFELEEDDSTQRDKSNGFGATHAPWRQPSQLAQGVSGPDLSRKVLTNS